MGSPFFHACEGKGATRFVITSRKNPPVPDLPDLPGTRTDTLQYTPKTARLQPNAEHAGTKGKRPA